MNTRITGLILLTLTGLLIVKCSKKEQLSPKPALFITLKDSAKNSVAGATVRLYKNVKDSGITQMSDSNGVVIFENLEPELYYWLATKGCANNRGSQTTLKRPLIHGVVLYGYSVMSETGILKITNKSAERYKVSDTLFTITLSRDTPYIAYPQVGTHLIHSKIASDTSTGAGKDTLIKVGCGDTTNLIVPY